MPPQARLGDSALIPADAHGCPACPHTATGPAVAGSRNVFVNGLPAVRVNDPGIHSACCGANIWQAKTGSKSVLINGRPAHRLNDLVQHCGGIGRTVQGSHNVIVGDRSSARNLSNGQQRKTKVAFEFIDHATQEPLANLLVKIAYPNGSIVEHKTNQKGKIIINQCEDGNYCIAKISDTFISETYKIQEQTLEE